MKKYFILLSIVLFLTSCGSTKNTLPETPNSPEVPEVITLIEAPEVPKIPETPTPPIPQEEKEIIPQTAIEKSPEVEKTQTQATTVETLHLPFDTLLQEHVSPEGNVNYAGFAKDRATLRAYIASLGEQLPDDSWSKNKKLAYWMNAYNAMTVDLILRNLPLQSIKDIKGPWEQRLWKLGSKWYNLDEIEHKILREMGEPRIHFGINCASFSCPPLANKAFMTATVDQQLEALAIAFVNDEKRNTLTTDAVEISKIFNWFSKDFKTDGSVIDYLNKYAKNPISPNAKVRYKDYDWNLNK